MQSRPFTRRPPSSRKAFLSADSFLARRRFQRGLQPTLPARSLSELPVVCDTYAPPSLPITDTVLHDYSLQNGQCCKVSFRSPRPIGANTPPFPSSTPGRYFTPRAGQGRLFSRETRRSRGSSDYLGRFQCRCRLMASIKDRVRSEPLFSLTTPSADAIPTACRISAPSPLAASALP